MKVMTVAQASAARTNRCHGRSASSGLGRTGSVEISELIVETLRETGVCRGRRLGNRLGMAGPLLGSKADKDDAGCANQIGEQPGERAEALVERRAQHFFVAVSRDHR